MNKIFKKAFSFFNKYLHIDKSPYLPKSRHRANLLGFVSAHIKKFVVRQIPYNFSFCFHHFRVHQDDWKQVRQMALFSSLALFLLYPLQLN